MAFGATWSGVDIRAMASHPIDLTRLEDFTAGDPDLERELSTLFVASGERYLSQMGDILANDGEDWSAPCHALKGASGNIGAHEVARLARSIEHQPPDQKRIEDLRQAFDEATAFLRKRLRGHGLDLPSVGQEACPVS